MSRRHCLWYMLSADKQLLVIPIRLCTKLAVAQQHCSRLVDQGLFRPTLLKPCMAAGLDGMSYSDLTAMLVSRTVPQPHHLGTAQETPASLPIPGSPLAHHSHGAHAQNSFGHKDMRPSSHSMSIGSRHGADTDSVVPASAIHSSSISNRQVDASLQEAGTEAEYTCVPAQEQPAATAETVDVQSTVGASDQHNACQIPPAVHSGSKHPSEADAHDVLHVLAGVQSSDDLSMQQLQTLAGMDAQSSDGTTTLCDSAPESISSLDVDDRLPSLGQAAATHRPGAGHIDDSTVLGLSDLSTEVMSSSLYAEETENVPEQQRAGSAEGTAMPGMDDMLVSVSYEVSYQVFYLFVEVVVAVEQSKPTLSQLASRWLFPTLLLVRKHASLLLPFFIGLPSPHLCNDCNPPCPSPILSISHWIFRSKCNESPLMNHNWLHTPDCKVLNQTTTSEHCKLLLTNTTSMQKLVSVC